jgi:hypothetical protein
MKVCALMIAACALAACAGPDYRTYDPPTIGLGAHGERQATRLQDLQYCRKEVEHFHTPVGLADAASGAGRGAEGGLGVALVYPPAVGIGGAVGLVNGLSGQTHAVTDVKMLVNCLAGEGIQHGYVVIDANR